MNHLGDRLVELALGTLAPGERVTLEEHVASCDACREELVRTQRTMGGLALDLRATPPPAALRERLSAAVRGSKRFWPFVDRVAGLFDVAPDEAERVLGRIDEPSAWVADAVVPRATLLLVSPGPRREGGIASLIRMPPGSRYPRHRHLGEERFLMLQGGVRFDDGSSADAGDSVLGAAGTAHHFVVLPGQDCIAAVVLTGPVELESPGA
ncbi:MAG: cupin domain-containing protein [bacterium]